MSIKLTSSPFINVSTDARRAASATSGLILIERVTPLFERFGKLYALSFRFDLDFGFEITLVPANGEEFTPEDHKVLKVALDELRLREDNHIIRDALMRSITRDMVEDYETFAKMEGQYYATLKQNLDEVLKEAK